MDIQNNTEYNCKTFEHYIKELIMSGQSKLSEKEILNLIYAHKTNSMSLRYCKELSKSLYNEMYRFGVIQPFLDDPLVSEIMINGLSKIIIERQGKIIFTNVCFPSEDVINNIIQKIVSSVNRRVNASSPIVDARLDDGSRVNIVLKPVAVNGPIITIRKFEHQTMNLDYYIEKKIMDIQVKEFLIECVKCRKNIFVSGGTSSGKTTFLNALSFYIPDDERVITIEDSAELKLSHLANLVTLETKAANYEGQGEITMDQLVKCSLRMRPDRIIVGEVRGKEALDMIHAMNTGHDGSMSTGHSNSSRDMLNRLELMILSNMELPLNAVKRMIARSIDMIVHLERNSSGQRSVHTIDCIDFDTDYVLKPLYKLKGDILVKVGDFN